MSWQPKGPIVSLPQAALGCAYSQNHVVREKILRTAILQLFALKHVDFGNILI